MERNVPEYVSASVPIPLTARVPWYKSTFPSYFGIFLFVGYYLKLSAPTIGYASVYRLLVGSAGGGAALLRPLLLCACDAGHADRPQSLCRGLIHLWHHRRLSDPRNPDGSVAGGLGSRGRDPGVALHHAGAQSDIENPLQRHRDHLALQPRVGSDQRTQLRQRVRQVHELGSLRHDADRPVDQPRRHRPLPTCAA